MLVLSRREKSKIILPDLGVEIKVLKISGSQVKIGIDAPDSIRVIRGELNESNTSLEKNSTTQVNKTERAKETLNETRIGETRIGYRVCRKTDQRSIRGYRRKRLIRSI